MKHVFAKLMQPRILGAFRHMLSSLGPLLAANGWLSDATWQTIVGVAMAALAFGWSWFAPEKKQ